MQKEKKKVPSYKWMIIYDVFSTVMITILNTHITD